MFCNCGMPEYGESHLKCTVCMQRYNEQPMNQLYVFVCVCVSYHNVMVITSQFHVDMISKQPLN